MTTDEGGGRSTFDAWNRLVLVRNAAGGFVSGYGYDARGRRITEEGSQVTELYLDQAGKVIQETVQTVVATQYVWSPVGGNFLVARDTLQGTPARIYIQQDPLGSVTSIMNTSGVVLERYLYDPYGSVTVRSATWGELQPASTLKWKYYFQAGRLDDATGAYSFGTRDLMPGLGRWQENDHIGYAGGDANLYRFVENNPTNETDSTGMFLDSLWEGTIAPWISSWDNVLGNVKTGGFAQFSNFTTGVGDTLSFNATRRFREFAGYDDVVDRTSSAYGWGQVVGTVYSIGLSFVNPCALAGNFGTALRALNGIQALGGSMNAVENLAKGNFGAAALDALGVLGNIAQMRRACFEEGTLIEARGGWKPIEDLIPTVDYVASRNENDPNGPVEYKLVEEKFVRWAWILKLHLEDGKVLGTTGEHPFYKEGQGWVPCHALKTGARIWSKECRWITVEEVFDTGEFKRVYNCRVADYATYFVGGEDWNFSVWAHNTYDPTSTKSIQKLLEGKGQIKDLLSNKNIPKGVSISELIKKSPAQLEQMVTDSDLSSKVLEMIKKAFEGRDLGGRRGG